LPILFRSFDLIVSKDFYVIWLSDRSTINAPDDRIFQKRRAH